MTPPIVTAIAIFWNAEAFFEAAIESVLAQTDDRWELLLVDDGSTDGSTAIAQRYAAQYPHQIRYITHPDRQNLGMSASRNLGIAEARGQYLSFIDADDWWAPQKVAQQVTLLEAHPTADFLCAPARWWYGWTGKEKDCQRDFIQKWQIEGDRIVAPPALLLLFLQDEWASLCDLLIRRDAIAAIGGYESSFRGMYEDQAFHAKLCLQSTAYVARDCWYWYRQHPQACTATTHQLHRGHAAARQIFLDWLESYLLKLENPQPEVWSMLQRELWPYRHPLLFRVQARVRSLVNAR